MFKDLEELINEGFDSNQWVNFNDSDDIKLSAIQAIHWEESNPHPQEKSKQNFQASD